MALGVTVRQAIGIKPVARNQLRIRGYRCHHTALAVVLLGLISEHDSFLHALTIGPHKLKTSTVH